MTLGPHEANLRGELALEQVRAVQDSAWPALQGDIERGVVREIADALIVPIDDALTREGAAYGVRIASGKPPAPVAPNLLALPGRYRVWILPTCGVAVALERLEDEDVYLRAHRTHLLELQGVCDDAHLRRRGLRLEGPLLKKDAHQDTVRFGSSPSEVIRVTGVVYRRMIVGVSYRIRRRWFSKDIVEAVAPEIVSTNVGPYR